MIAMYPMKPDTLRLFDRICADFPDFYPGKERPRVPTFIGAVCPICRGQERTLDGAKCLLCMNLPREYKAKRRAVLAKTWKRGGFR